MTPDQKVQHDRLVALAERSADDEDLAEAEITALLDGLMDFRLRKMLGSRISRRSLNADVMHTTAEINALVRVNPFQSSLQADPPGF